MIGHKLKRDMKMSDGENTEAKPDKAVSPINGQPVPAGRPKGVPNKSTTEFKQAVNDLISHATPHMIEWLGEIAAKDPDKAMDVVYKFAQFGYPLLARTDMALMNPDGSGLKIEIVRLADDKTA